MLLSGWNITDFGERPFSAAEKPEAMLVEAIVGLLDQEGTGHVLAPEAFNAALRDVMGEMGLPLHRTVTAETLAAIRRDLDRLHGQWLQVPAGGSMVLALSVVQNDGGA